MASVPDRERLLRPARTTPPSHEPHPVHPVGVLVDVLPRWLVVVDAAALFGLLLVVHLVRYGQPFPATAPTYALAGAVLLVALTVAGLYLAGMYDGPYIAGYRGFVARVASTVGLSALVYVAVTFFLGSQPLPRGSLAVWTVLAALAAVQVRSRARKFLTRVTRGRQVVLVGAPEAREPVRRAVEEDRSSQSRVVATAEGLDELVAALNATPCTHVMLTGSALVPAMYPKVLHALEDAGISALVRIGPADTLLGLKHVVEVGGVPFAPLQSQSSSRAALTLKRLLDLAILAAVAVPAAVLAAGVALRIKAIDRGPVLFRQERVGKGGKPFTLVKFRTMRVDAEQACGPVLAARDDDRVLPGAAWLRSTRLDELPQLVNVLRGEMSFVGPRPERPEFAQELAARIPGYERRHEVPPGLTGLAQVHGRYDTDPLHKLGHDLQYIVNHGPMVDLQILGRTLAVMVKRRL